MKEEPFYPELPVGRPAPFFLRRVSWGAIFAGLVVALVLDIVLCLLGVAIGASSVNFLTQSQPAKGMGIGSAIWFGISGIIATFAGACVAGRLSGGPRRVDGLLHGVATWATASLLSIFVLTTAVGAVLGGTAKLLGTSVSAGAQSTSSSGVNLDTLKEQAGAILSPTGRDDTKDRVSGMLSQAQQNPELIAALTRMFSHGGAAADPQDRDKAINILSSQNNMSRDEAASTVDQWDQQFQQTKAQTKEKAQEVGTTAAKGVAAGAWFGFAFMILSAAAAAWGGFLGTGGLRYLRPEAPSSATV